MNIFYIPSWYPSNENPVYGVFHQVLIQSIAENHRGFNLGISLWGQGIYSHQLWWNEPLINIRKLRNFKKLKPNSQKVNNVYTFYDPALVWSRKIIKGNINGIYKSCERNFLQFTKEVNKVNVLHAQVSYPGGYIAMMLSRKYGIPYIITEQMSPFPMKGFLKRNGELVKWVKKPLSHAKHIVAISPSQKEDIEKHGMNDVHVIPNPVDENYFSVAPLKKSTPFVFFFLGRMEPQKGVPVLIKAFKKLSKEYMVELWLGGDGQYIQEYKQLSNKYNLENRIKWLGLIHPNETKQYFQMCHSFVLSSHHESLGVVVLEALACGKPVVATKCGGPNHIINKTNGALCNVNDPQDLFLKMKSVIENYDKYDYQEIRSDFMNRFSKKKVVEKIVKIYRNVGI